MSVLLTGIWIGTGVTAAIALCVLTWVWARQEKALNEAFDDGIEAGLASSPVQVEPTKLTFVDGIGRG